MTNQEKMKKNIILKTTKKITLSDIKLKKIITIDLIHYISEIFESEIIIESNEISFADKQEITFLFNYFCDKQANNNESFLPNRIDHLNLLSHFLYKEIEKINEANGF